MADLLWYAALAGSFYLWTYGRLGQASNPLPSPGRKPPALPA